MEGGLFSLGSLGIPRGSNHRLDIGLRCLGQAGPCIHDGSQISGILARVVWQLFGNAGWAFPQLLTGLVAYAERPADFESEGCRFESYRARLESWSASGRPSLTHSIVVGASANQSLRVFPEVPVVR